MSRPTSKQDNNKRVGDDTKGAAGRSPNHTTNKNLSYRKQIARQLRTQYV